MTQARTIAVVLVVLLLACAGAERPPTVGDDGPEDTVTVLYGYSERVLMPWVNMPAMHLVFESLFGHDIDGNIEGRLVKDWEHSEDGHTWTYHLRTDVRWHDGVPVTAHDIAFTYTLYTHPTLMRAYGPGSVDATALDDSTVQVTYHSQIWDAFDAWTVFLPRHLLEGLDPEASWDWAFSERPVGNGPYRYVRHVPKTMVELEANPDYYRGTPSIEHVRLRLGGGNAALELKAGTVDIAPFGTVGPEVLPALRADDRFRVYWKLGNGVLAVYWNLHDPVVGDVRVRRALAHAVDRPAIAAALDLPPDAPFRDVAATNRQRDREDHPPPLELDLTRARALLAEAGWTDEDGDGIRERDGRPLRIVIQTSAANPLVPLQGQLKTIGVEIVIDATAAQVVGTMFTRLRRGQLDDVGAVQAFAAPAGSCVPRWFYTLLGYPPDFASAVGYEDAALADLATRLDATIIPEERDVICRETWPIVQRDQPVLFLVPQVWYSAAHERIEGLRNVTRVFPLSNMADLRVRSEP